MTRKEKKAGLTCQKRGHLVLKTQRHKHRRTHLQEREPSHAMSCDSLSSSSGSAAPRAAVNPIESSALLISCSKAGQDEFYPDSFCALLDPIFDAPGGGRSVLRSSRPASACLLSFTGEGARAAATDLLSLEASPSSSAPVRAHLGHEPDAFLAGHLGEPHAACDPIAPVL